MWTPLRALPTINYNPIYENVDSYIHKMTGDSHQNDSVVLTGSKSQFFLLSLQIFMECLILFIYCVFANLCTEKKQQS